LFDKLGATDEQLDFPVVYASGINGWTSLVEGEPGEQWGPDMSALFNTVLNHVKPNAGDPAAPLQLQISALDFSTFVGRIGVGRISQGMPLAKSIHGIHAATGITYARRSVFWRARQPLLVVEAFLPNFWLQARAQRAHR
jgi:predicted membrane GTPase involved in stress response